VARLFLRNACARGVREVVVAELEPRALHQRLVGLHTWGGVGRHRSLVQLLVEQPLGWWPRRRTRGRLLSLEVVVATLLHELVHMVRGSDGRSHGPRFLQIQWSAFVAAACADARGTKAQRYAFCRRVRLERHSKGSTELRECSEAAGRAEAAGERARGASAR